MKAVFLDSATIESSISLTKIAQNVSQLKTFATTEATEIAPRTKNAEIIITNKVVIDGTLIQQLSNLKLICVAATGTNNVDIKAAQKANVAVTNVSNYSTRSVSQYVFSFLLNYYHQVEFYINLHEQRPWHNSKTFCQIDAPINELAGKKIAIIGYGNLGRQIAKIAEAFGMDVLIAERKGAKLVRDGRNEFSQVIKQADVISLHCPLTAETENLISAQEFSLMKTECVLINSARGPVVNSNDLAAALKQNQIAHAIIDVLEQEPPPNNHPLLDPELTNLTLTHHIAWGSLQAQQKLIDTIGDNIASFLNGRHLNRVDLNE